MSREISPNAISSVNASSTHEVWLAMIELNHAEWSDAIRLVRNTVAVEHQGFTYNPFPFDVSLPDEEAENIPIVNWTAANVNGELVELFRSVSGVIKGRLFWVLASSPDDIEIGPMDLEIRSFEYDANSIQGNMVIEPIMDAAFGYLNMDNTNAPGLF